MRTHSFLLIGIFISLPACIARRSDWDSPSTDGVCEGAGSDLLPKDLRVEAGGSKPFGGPQQAEDGSIDMWGGNFGLAISEKGVTEHVIKFNATVTSVLKGKILG
jgi:hypothetical protein